MRIEYTEKVSGEFLPKYIGIAPLQCPLDAERWRIGVVVYDNKNCPVMIRDFADQKKWTERATLPET